MQYGLGLEWLARMGWEHPETPTPGATLCEGWTEVWWQDVAPLAAVLHSNLAAVHLKEQRGAEAVWHAQAALRVARSSKAFFREARGRVLLGQLEQAEEALRRGLKLVPEGSTEER